MNFIRARGLNHRQFIGLLEDVNADYHDVLYHSNVRWLSLGKMLKQVWDLKDEIILFLDMKNKSVDFVELKKPGWLLDLAFAVDIIGHLNTLNISLHGKGVFAYRLYWNVNPLDIELFFAKLL